MRIRAIRTIPVSSRPMSEVPSAITDEDIKVCVKESDLAKAKDWWRCKHEACSAYVFSEPHAASCPYFRLSLVKEQEAFDGYQADSLSESDGEDAASHQGPVSSGAAPVDPATLHSFTDALVPDGHAEPSAGPAASPHAQTTPTDASVGSESEWGMARDPSTGGVYYYNKATGSVQWEPPVGWKTGHKLHHKLGQRTSAEQRPGAGTTQPAQVQRQVYDNPIDMVQAAIARKRQELASGAVPAGVRFGNSGTSSSYLRSFAGNTTWLVHWEQGTGKPYYYNTATGISQWDKPADYDGPELTEAIKAADAAASVAASAHVLTAATGSLLASSGVTASGTPLDASLTSGEYSVTGTWNPITGRFQDPTKLKGTCRADDYYLKSEYINEQIAKTEAKKRKVGDQAPKVDWKEYKAEKKKLKAEMKLKKLLEEEEYE